MEKEGIIINIKTLGGDFEVAFPGSRTQDGAPPTTPAISRARVCTVEMLTQVKSCRHESVPLRLQEEDTQQTEVNDTDNGRVVSNPLPLGFTPPRSEPVEGPTDDGRQSVDGLREDAWPPLGGIRKKMDRLSRVVGTRHDRHLFFVLAAVLLVALTLFFGTETALAQEQGGGGDGDAIQQTLINIRDYLAALSFGVGGIGFVASLLVKGYASINENAHVYAGMGMRGSLWCIIGGVIVTPILSIAAGLAGGG